VCEYAYSYALPSDFLRVLKIFNGTTDSIEADLPYKIESKDLITDQTTVYLVYIALDVDPTNYDAYLYEALATSIAADLTYPITNNASLVTKYRDLADERLREARFIDATENSVSTVESGEFVDARL